jgi:hypothetical protein
MCTYGAFHSGAAVVVLVNTWLDFEVFTTHHILPRQEKLVVTGADSAQRRVFELNAEPAAEEYARHIGVPWPSSTTGCSPPTRWRCAFTTSTTCGRSSRCMPT